jgi:hypothetical protein
MADVASNQCIYRFGTETLNLRKAQPLGGVIAPLSFAVKGI